MLPGDINAALREVGDRRRRAAALERMRQMVDEGLIDFSVIENAVRPFVPDTFRALPAVAGPGGVA